MLTYDTAFFSVADPNLFVAYLDLDSAFLVIKDPDPDPAVQVILYPYPNFRSTWILNRKGSGPTWISSIFIHMTFHFTVKN